MADDDVRIDLNADVGEGYEDAPLFAFLTSVNVACGAHAGNEDTMRSTIEGAAKAGLAIGAHPSFPDREGFGRRITTRDAREIRTLVAEQTGALAEIARALGTSLAHVKPHGALYNLAAADRSIADAVALGVCDVDSSYALFGLAGSESIEAARAAGLASVAEAFVDRGYRDDGTLAPRGEPGALVESADAAAVRAVALAKNDPIRAVSGASLRIDAATLCLHGDTPGAFAMARAVHGALVRARVSLGRS